MKKKMSIQILKIIQIQIIIQSIIMSTIQNVIMIVIMTTPIQKNTKIHNVIVNLPIATLIQIKDIAQRNLQVVKVMRAVHQKKNKYTENTRDII